MNIEEIVSAQRAYFLTGATRPVEARIACLKKLQGAIRAGEARINEALKKDLNKAPSETYMTETGLVLDELRCQIGHIRRWSRERTVRRPSRSFPRAPSCRPSPTASRS